GDQDLYDAIDDELSEFYQFGLQGQVLGPGYVTREMEHRKGSSDWVQMRVKTRMFAAERLHGTLSEYVQQDARHFQWSGTDVTVAPHAAAGVKAEPPTPTPLPPPVEHKLGVTPKIALTTTGEAQHDQSGYYSSFQWRYVGYTADTVLYRLRTNYTV